MFFLPPHKLDRSGSRYGGKLEKTFRNWKAVIFHLFSKSHGRRARRRGMQNIYSQYWIDDIDIAPNINLALRMAAFRFKIIDFSFFFKCFFFLAGFCLGMDRHLYHFVYSYFKSATGAIQVKIKTKYWAAILNSDDIFVVVLFFLSSFSFFAFFWVCTVGIAQKKFFCCGF